MNPREYFENRCMHITQDGEDAYWPTGQYGEGFEQCVLCGDVKCTEPQYEDSNRDLAALPY